MMDIRRSIAGKITSVVIIFLYCWMVMCPSIAIAVEKNEYDVFESGKVRPSSVSNCGISSTAETPNFSGGSISKRLLCTLLGLFYIGNVLAGNALEAAEKTNFSNVLGPCTSLSTPPEYCPYVVCWDGTKYIHIEAYRTIGNDCISDQAFCPVPDVGQNVYLSYFALETVEKDNFSKVSGPCISTSKVPGVCYQTACWDGTGFIPTETVCPDDQDFCPVPDVGQNVYLSYFSLPS